MPTTHIIVTPAVAGTGQTAAEAWRRLADELGFLHTTVTSAAAAGGEATRVAIADAFRDDEEGFDALGMAWLYAGGAVAEQRRIVSDPEAGYLGEHGLVMASRPFSSTLAENTPIDVTSPLPVKRYASIKGLLDCQNEGLSRIWVTARLTVTGNGTDQYDLSSYPAIRSYEQLRGIYDTVQMGSTFAPEMSTAGYRFVVNGVTRTLVTNAIYATSETFYLDVAVRADRLISNGSSWSLVSTPGLQGDAWQHAAPEEHALAFGMRQALRYLMRYVRQTRSMSKEEKAGWLVDLAERYGPWRAACAKIVMDEFPKPLQEFSDGFVSSSAFEPAWD